MDNTHITSKPQKSRKYCHIILSKFLKETTLHALKYVGDVTLSLWERIYFMISFVTVVVVAIQLAVIVYEKWKSSPVIIGMSSYTTSIQDVPFPAITICNMNQAKHSKVTKYPVDSLEYAMLHKMCFQPLNFSAYKDLKPKHRGDTYADFVVQNNQSCNEMILLCKFGLETRNCSDYFREVLLDEGLCCVFNALHPFYLFKGEYDFLRDYTTSSGRIPVDWSPETGYPKKLPTNYYPRPALGAGTSLGFTVVLNADINDYHCSSTNGEGFKVMLYNPIDAPHIKETGLPIKIGHQSRFRVVPRSYVGGPNLRIVRPIDRYCFFNEEKELLYYKYYTHRNCQSECDAKFMLRLCNCIPYYMPLIYANATQCHVRHFHCTIAAEKDSSDVERFECKKQCLPSCHDLAYYPDLTVTGFADGNYGMHDAFFRNLSKEYIKENLASVQFYYHSAFFRSYVRSPYTGFTEYLSQTGGIMSLFVGFGVISLAEIFFFAVLYPIFGVIFKRFPKVNTVTEVRPCQSDNVEYSSSGNVFTVRSNRYPLMHRQGLARKILKTRRIRNNIGNFRDASNFNANPLDN